MAGGNIEMSAYSPTRHGLAISNRQARRLWLAANHLATPPTGPPTGPANLPGLIRGLGFLQIDTVRNIVRAHDHILWSRMQHYREGMVWPLLRRRELFEHFTHDASLIPMDVYPMWQRQFTRLGQRAANAAWYRSGLTDGDIRAIRERIATEGPLSTHAFESRPRGAEMWARPPHKKALEQMWYAGELATSHRENFVKYYDLGENVFPARQGHDASMREQAEFLCDGAIERLWIANSGEIRRFWDAVTPGEVAEWAGRRRLVPARIEGADGRWHACLAVPDIEQRLATITAGSRRLRIINPFDPAIRDRRRLLRLFGFAYRNEMFVPPAARRWGYYVYPLLEGDRFVGRIELKGDRRDGLMRVAGFWPEPGIRWSAARIDRLHAELRRFARLGGLSADQISPASLAGGGSQAASP
ncbi:MAG: crosslink repair DNA glycosylase YcaQ family protein [Rhodobiaceae bacterium]